MRSIILLIVMILLFYVFLLFPETKKRKKEVPRPTPPRIHPEISERDFVLIAKHEAKSIKRITRMEITGANVYGTVASNSGLSDWVFELRFGYIGQLTGSFEMYSENDDSDIPRTLGNRIRVAIRSFPDTDFDASDYYAFCPYCGEKLPIKIGSFCTFCGKAFM